jgi:hypothetical protein
VAHEQSRRKAAVHLDLAVPAGLDSLEHRRRDVRREDLGGPAEWQVLVEQHREAVRLLPARACRGPDPDLLRVPAVLDERGQHHVGEGLVGRVVAEPGRLVDGERVDGLALLGRVDLESRDVRVDVGHSGRPCQWEQPRLGKVLLAGAVDHRRLAQRER